MTDVIILGWVLGIFIIMAAVCKYMGWNEPRNNNPLMW